jgi:hypothetical protein
MFCNCMLVNREAVSARSNSTEGFLGHKISLDQLHYRLSPLYS